MNSNNSLVPNATKSINNSKNDKVFKIRYALIKNLCDKKSSKQKIEKILESSEPKTNCNTAAETITTLNSKINIKTIKKNEISEKDIISQKRHKPKIRKKHNCKLIEEFINTFNDISKKCLNKSYNTHIDLMKKKQKKFFSMQKINNINGYNNKIKNITIISVKAWLSNCKKNNNLKRYQALSASVKNKYLKNKNREIPKQLKMISSNIINFESIFNKNKLFPAFYKEINFCTSENKNDIKNVECEEIAQRRPGQSKLKNDSPNKNKSKINSKQNITQITRNKKKNDFLETYINIKLNPKMTNNLTKFKGLKKKISNPSPLSNNQRAINKCIQELINKNNNGSKKINNANFVQKKLSFNIRNSLKTNTLNDSKKFDGDVILDYFNKKSQNNLKNKPNDRKPKSKILMNKQTYIFDNIKKNVNNKRFGNMVFINYKQQKNANSFLSKTIK